MALIPSESLNFPDGFRAAVGWKLARRAAETAGSARATPKSLSPAEDRYSLEPEQPLAGPAVSELPAQIRSVKLPELEPQTESASQSSNQSEPLPVERDVSPTNRVESSQQPDRGAVVPSVERKPLPQPPPEAAVSSATKTPARIPIVPRRPKPRPVDPTEQSPAVVRSKPKARRQPEPMKPSPPPREEWLPAANLPPRKIRPENSAPDRRGALEGAARKLPAPRFDAVQTEFDFFARAQRRSRWIRFSLSESLAVACLIVLVRFGIGRTAGDPTLTMLSYILIGASAAGAVVIPILFVRNNPARWERIR